MQGGPLQPTIHASCVALGTLGVLVRGASATGKSSFCDRLVQMAHLRGHFATWVADDRVHLDVSGERLIAHPAHSLAGKLEVRGLGILETRYVQSAAIDLVVDLLPLGDIDRLPEFGVSNVSLQGITVPMCKLAENRSDEGMRRLRWVVRQLFPNCPGYF